MASTDVKIATNALILIGHTPIQNLADDERVEALYPVTYESFLSQHRWNFATKKAQLSQLVTQPLNEYRYAYQLPSDLLVLDRTYPASNYKIVGDQLHSNANEVEIDYRFKVAEQYLPAYAVEALEFLLASKLAIPITSNKATAQEYREAYEGTTGIGGALRRAKFLDSQSAPADNIQDNPFVDARAGDNG